MAETKLLTAEASEGWWSGDPLSPPLGYALALVSVVLAWLVRTSLDSYLGYAQTFGTFYLAVALSARWAGWCPALLAAALGYLAAHWFFLPPRESLKLDDLVDVIELLTYCFVTGTIILLINSLGQARRRARASTQTALEEKRVLEAEMRQRKQAEQQLRFQLLLTQSIADTAAVCILVTDEKGCVTFMNQEVEKVFGFSFAELQGKPMHDAIHHHYPDGRPFPQSECPIGQVYSSGVTTRSYEEVFFRKDGSTVPVVCSNAALWVEGKIAGAVLVAQDITRRKRAEQTLRESEQRLRALFDNAGVGIVEVDASDRFIAVNHRVCQMLGYRPEELLGMTVHELTAPEDRRRSDEVNAQLLAGRCERLDYEKRYLHRSGSPLWVHVTASVIRDSGGRFLRAVAIIADSSERKRAEQALQEAQAQLKAHAENLERTVAERTAKLAETVAELEHFSYTITHDMRAPLRAMRGFGGLLLEECANCLRPTRREYLQRIANSAGRMDKLITDALQFSGVMRHHLDLEPVDPAALLRGILESYPLFQPPHARIHIDGPLPVVLGNEAAMTQCFSNFLGNAVKFVRPGQPPEVSIWAEPRGEFVRFWFEDKGIGIDKQYQDKIWDMFQRLSNSYEGTGIGLALVRKVVGRMQGQAGVESEPGRGSRFWVELKRPAPQIQPANGSLAA